MDKDLCGLSLKEANKDFIRDVKSGLDNIKKSFNKNKD